MAFSHSGESGPWRVGVLFSRTGCTAVIERTQLYATLLAIEEINSAGGINQRQLVPIIYDPRSDPALFARLAKRLIIEDRVRNIFGCYTSSSRKAVVPVVERLNALLWYPTPYEGFEFSPNVIYTGPAPNQNSVPLCRFLMRDFGRRFFLVGSDYVYPRESNRVMRELVLKNGGTVVGETYLPLGALHREFVPIVRDIKRLGADVIFSTVVGDSTIALYQTYADAGLDPKVTPIASLTTSEAEVRAMGCDVGEGHITAAPYFESLNSPTNASFVEKYRRRFGDDEPPNMCAEAAYFQVLVFARAVEQINSADPDLLRLVVAGIELEAPQGRVAISHEYNHASVWTRIGRLNREGRFEIVEGSAGPVDADPYLIGCGRALT